MSRLRRLVALAWEAVLFEVALYRSLARWVARRPDVPTGTTPIGYGQLAGPMMWLWIFGSAVEVVVLDVVLHRWLPAVRIPFLVLGVWGVVWMLGLLASMRVRPHLLADAHDAQDDTPDAHLVVRSGARTRVVVPLAAVEAVRGAGHDVPGLVRTLQEQDGLLLVGMGETNLELMLGAPTTLETSRGPWTVERVGLYVDAPREVAATLRRAAEVAARS